MTVLAALDRCLLVFDILIYVFHFISFSDPYGRVVISASKNDTTESYSFNENYRSLFTIPVYLILVNGTTGDILPDPPQVDVSVCIWRCIKIVKNIKCVHVYFTLIVLQFIALSKLGK